MKKQTRPARYRDEAPVGRVREIFASVGTGETLYVGIDPGMEGALAFYAPNSSNANRLMIVDFPIYTTRSESHSKGKRVVTQRNSYDYAGIVQLFDPLLNAPEKVVVALERGQPMQGDTGRTGFSIGVSYGMWPMYLTAFNVAWDEIMPAVWKRGMGLLGADKDASRRTASRLFPAARQYFLCKKDHNRAEAVLIAEYAMRQRQGVQKRGKKSS